MNQWARDWRIPDHERLIPTLSLPDPDDRHVLAAAIAAEVGLIVTFNLADFPVSALAPYAIRAVHPDDFAYMLLNDESEAFVAAVRSHREALCSPHKSVDEYLATLAACGLRHTAELLSAHADSI